MISNKRGLRLRKLYRPYFPREAAARGLLEVSQCGRLRKTLASGPSGEGCREQQLRQVFIVIIGADRYLDIQKGD